MRQGNCYAKRGAKTSKHLRTQSKNGFAPKKITGTVAGARRILRGEKASIEETLALCECLSAKRRRDYARRLLARLIQFHQDESDTGPRKTIASKYALACCHDPSARPHTDSRGSRFSALGLYAFDRFRDLVVRAAALAMGNRFQTSASPAGSWDERNRFAKERGAERRFSVFGNAVTHFPSNAKVNRTAPVGRIRGRSSDRGLSRQEESALAQVLKASKATDVVYWGPSCGRMALM